MKTQDEKRRFVEMRAKGISYAKIAQELKTSKQTLIAWSREFEEEIQNLQAIEREALLEEFQISRKARLEVLGRESQRIREELTKRDLKDVPTEKLWESMFKISQSLNREGVCEASPNFKVTEEEDTDDLLRSFSWRSSQWKA